MKLSQDENFQEKEEKKKKQGRVQDLVWLLLVLICFIIFCYSGFRILTTTLEYRKGQTFYEDTAKRYLEVEPQEEHLKLDDIDSNVAQKEQEETSREWYELVRVDLEGLRQQNPDIIGWIFFETEDISYPILYSGDNAKYLRTSYTGEYLTAGSIFLEARNTPDFSDHHSILYGHNMKDLSMFGKLKYYGSDKEYWKEHEYFQVLTPQGKYRYRIFAYKEVEPDSDVYQTFQTGGEEFFQFLNNTLRADNWMENDIYVSSEDLVITLSTCWGDENRFIVSAVCVDSMK